MANQYYFYHNPGALLRRFFPKQLNTQALIFIWTVVFILNIVAVVLIQNFAIYKITDVSKKGLEQVSYFENCEIKEVKEMPYDDMQVDAYRVSYISESGVEETVYLEEFPVSIFERYCIKTSSEPTSAIFWHGNQIQKLAGVYIAFGVVMLGIEFFLYSVFHRLFRE